MTFVSALQNCPSPGAGVHVWLLSIANRAAIAKIPPARAVALITRAMSRPPSPSSEVVSAVRKAYGERGLSVKLSPYAQPQPVPAPQLAKLYIAKGIDMAGGLDRTYEYLRTASGLQTALEAPGSAQAEIQFRTLFYAGELITCECETSDKRFLRATGTLEDWLDHFQTGRGIPQLFCANPIKVDGGLVSDGPGKAHRSMRCSDAVAVFRHCVAEFDSLDPNPEISKLQQAALWIGFGLDNVATITDSGGKSLHALLRVNVTSLEDWKTRVAKGLFHRVLVPLGADPACKDPSRLTRLAGAERLTRRNAIQSLLYAGRTNES